jgi:integrase
MTSEGENETESVILMDGRVRLYKRPRSRCWQCYAHVGGVAFRVSTKEEILSAAKEFAEDWYFCLRGKHHAGEIKHGKTFREAAEQFRREYQVITQGQRSPKYVESIEMRLDVHLIPYFGDRVVSEITPGAVQEYRIHRVQNSKTGKPPARNTIHQEIMALRHVLKTAQRHGWLPYLPDLSAPYKTSGKIGHRAWFSADEYRKLYMATRRRSENPPPPFTKRWRWEYEQLHDYVLFMANTGLRPDEAARLEYRDVTVVRDRDTRETILEIEVRGKRGLGYCKSTAGAVRPFQRLVKRNKPQPADKVFPGDRRELFNTILQEEDLKFDRDGNRRTAYSLRHTYVCLRLLEGADIYQIAKNCRTSVEMIEKHYAVHLKNTLDAAAINVRRPRAHRRRRPAKKQRHPTDANPVG